LTGKWEAVGCGQVFAQGAEMEITIRMAVKADTDRVAELFNILNIESTPDFYRYRRQHSELAIARSECYVAVIGGDIVGAILLWLKDSETVEVVSLAVDPVRQRCGVGSALVQYALAHARKAGAKRIFLGTEDDYQVADFYLRIGMRDVSDRDQYPTARFFELQL